MRALRLRLGALACFAAAGLAAAPEPASADYTATLAEAVAAKPSQLEPLFERAVALRRAADGLDDPHARIAVHRDIAAAFAAKGTWMDATAHTGNALRLARTLGEPDLLIGLYLQQAGYLRQAGDPASALRDLDAADGMIHPLGRREAGVESSLLRAALLAADGNKREEAEHLYEALLADPQADRFTVELARARHTRFDLPAEFSARWQSVLQLARDAGNRAAEAEAHDRLGLLAAAQSEPARAAGHFAAAEQTGVAPARDAGLWLEVIAAYNEVDDRVRAHRALDAARALIDDAQQPGEAADLHEATGELLGREGDHAAGFRELQRANALRRQRDATRQAVPFARITPMVSRRETEQAAELAAVRNALRETELERTRLRQRQTAGLATVAVLLAALLGLAYAYKRRSAAALAAARDAAELRAERTHWQMLRYQLNPHFLFNALSSLGGLVTTDPPAAGRVIDRLSEFCQLALKGAHEDLRTLAQELEILRAYLDVEQAGAGDSLRVGLAAEPAALSCLVPPLLLQPLVENALKYGGQTSDECLELRLAARRSDGGKTLEIEIANTGRWLEPDRAPRPRAPVGLANVRERLARFGGSSADLTFAHDGHWVRAFLRLPARENPPRTPAP